MMRRLRALPKGRIWTDNELAEALQIRHEDLRKIASFGMSARLIWPTEDRWQS